MSGSHPTSTEFYADPRLLEHLKYSPDVVARDIKILHQRKDPKRFHYLVCLIDTIHGGCILLDASFQTFVQSDLPMTIFDVACDSSTYEHQTYTEEIQV